MFGHDENGKKNPNNDIADRERNIRGVFISSPIDRRRRRPTKKKYRVSFGIFENVLQSKHARDEVRGHVRETAQFLTAYARKQNHLQSVAWNKSLTVYDVIDNHLYVNVF